MSPGEAVAGLAPIIGGGGVAGILIAYLGYRAEVAKARADRLRPVASGIGDGLAAATNVEPLTNAVTLLTGALVRRNQIAEFGMGAERAAEFRAWLDERELRELLDHVRHAPGRRAGEG